MLIRDLSSCKEIIAGDRTLLRELLSPLNDPLDLRYSLAIARVRPGTTTRLHRLKNSEVYYIVSGEGEMAIDDERERVYPGCAVYIPPGSAQQIKNIGDRALVFLCIVDPAWRAEDEEVLG